MPIVNWSQKVKSGSVTMTGACWDSCFTHPAGREHSDNQQEERESHHHTRLSQKHLDTLSEEPGDMLPRRKDTPYQHQPPFIPGRIFHIILPQYFYSESR